MAKAKLVSACGQRVWQAWAAGAREGRNRGAFLAASCHDQISPWPSPPFGFAPHRKKTLLALFIALATIGLIAGLIVAFKPDKKEVTGPPEVSKKEAIRVVAAKEDIGMHCNADKSRER